MNAEEIKKIRKKLGLNQTEFGKMLGVGIRSVQNWEKGSRNMSESAEILLIQKLKHEHSTEEIQPEEDNYIELREVINEKGVGVPYYDVDFTASFLEVQNNQNINPDHYINHPFFRGCDYVVRASGQSMAKVIAHGDAIGLVELHNWREFFPFGEIYAIVTKDNYRMIKIITKGETDDTYTLISKPSYNKRDEFPPQQIKKDSILHLFKVQASSHLF